MTATIGLDIGGTKVLGALLDPDGSVVREHRVESPHSGLDELIATCVGIASELAPSGAPIGVGIAGLVDTEGRLVYAPNLPTLKNVPVRDALARAWGHPAVVDNDANVAALGEVTYGAARGARHALMVTLGTGIGGGIVLNGEIFRGAHGFAAEIGHIMVERDGPLCACGERGHWEAIASGTALGRIARERIAAGRAAAIVAAAGGAAAEARGEHVVTAALGGDPDALEIIGEFADNIALGLAALTNTLDPELIVISGGLVSLGSLLFDPLVVAFRLHTEASEHRPDVPLVPAVLGERAGAVGAAVLARDLL